MCVIKLPNLQKTFAPKLQETYRLPLVLSVLSESSIIPESEPNTSSETEQSNLWL